MTARDALDAVLAERYGPPVRQIRGADGPVARWLRQQAVEEAWAARKPYQPKQPAPEEKP